MPLLQFIDMKPRDSRDRLVTWHVPGCRSQQLYTCVSSQCNVQRGQWGQYLITGGHNNVMSHNYHTMIDF